MRVLLVGLVIASPVLGVVIFRGSGTATSRPEIRQISNATPAESTVRVPVEVIATGSAPEWVYIEVPSQDLPKPSSAR
jgi:UPF0716 family protein affecting phage T7 exclusion